MQPNPGNHAEQTYSSEISKIQTAPLILHLALKKKGKKEMTQMEEFDIIQTAAVYSHQCSDSLNGGSFSWLADSHNKYTTTRGYPLLCCQSLRQLRPVPEEHGECWESTSAGVHENRQKERSIKMVHVPSHPLLMNLTAVFACGESMQFGPQARAVAAHPENTARLL